jgi:hypothetical protein
MAAVVVGTHTTIQVTSLTSGEYRLRGGLLRIAWVGADELQVVVGELQTTAGQWQGLSAEFTAPAPSPGQPFQPSTAAVNGVNAAIGVAVAAIAARTQATAAAVAAAAAGYVNQDDTAAGALAALAQVTVT